MILFVRDSNRTREPYLVKKMMVEHQRILRQLLDLKVPMRVIRRRELDDPRLDPKDRSELLREYLNERQKKKRQSKRSPVQHQH